MNILEELKKDNPSRRTIDLQIFAEALAVYVEASKNIREHGAIVLHPRTGTPIENPYLKVQATKGAVLERMKLIKCDRVMRMLEL